MIQRFLTFALAACLAAALVGPAGAGKPSYRVVERTSVDSPGVTRRRVKIVVPAALTRAQLTQILTGAARAEAARSHARAVAIFAYRKGTDTRWTYTAGKCEWAPFGDWSRAAERVPAAQYRASVTIAPEYHAR